MNRIIYFVFCLTIIFTLPALADDPRSYSHGIGIASDHKDGHWIFFSSSGLIPQGEDENGNWTHDVYVGHWQEGMTKVSPRLFIQKPEAQEPVSIAQTDNGNIMVTFEDGWNTEHEVDQRYGIYAPDLRPVLSYPQTVMEGGHSGHAAAVGNFFIVFYSNDWVDGGGVDNLGTGKGVYAQIYDSAGKFIHYVPVVAEKREWWPLIAASQDEALLIWQAYIEGRTDAQLKFSLLDPATGKFTSPQILRDDLQYYTYAVQYIPAIKRFIVLGTNQQGHGFGYLIDKGGQITAHIDCMPAIVRESLIAVKGDEAFIPSMDNRLLRLKASPSSLSLIGALPSPIAWSSVGSVGVPTKVGDLHWFSLSKEGLKEADFSMKNSVPSSSQDLCQ